MKFKPKTAIMSGVAASVAGAATFYLKDRSNRIKVKETLTDFSTKVKDRATKFRNSNVPIEKAGDPKDMEDSKMVSEGAQTSVDYYNKTQQ